MFGVAWMVKTLHCSSGTKQGPKNSCKKWLLAVIPAETLFVRWMELLLRVKRNSYRLLLMAEYC